MRLDKFLVHMGLGSRKEVKKLVKGKNITVNGIVAKNSDMKIDENNLKKESLHIFVLFCVNTQFFRFLI